MVGALLVGSVNGDAAAPSVNISVSMLRKEDSDEREAVKRAYELDDLMDDIDLLSSEEAVRHYSVLFDMHGAFKLADASNNEDQNLNNQLRVFTRFRLRCGSGSDDVWRATESLVRCLIDRGRLRDLLDVLDDHFYVPSDGHIVKLAYALILSRNFVLFSRYFHRYCVRCKLPGGAEGSVVEIMKRVIAIFCEYTLDDPEMPRTRFVDSLMRSVCAYHARLVAAGFDAAAAESMSLLGHMDECQVVSWVDCFPMFEESMPLHDAFPYAADDAYRIAESVHTDGDMIRIEDVSAELESRGANRLLYLNAQWEDYHKYSRMGTVPSGPSGSAYQDVMSSLSSHMARGSSMGGISGTAASHSEEDAAFDDLSPPGHGTGVGGGRGRRDERQSGDSVTIELGGADDSEDSDDAYYEEEGEEEEDDEDSSDDFYDDSEDEDENGEGVMLDGEEGYEAEEAAAAARDTLESLVETAKTMASELSAAEREDALSGDLLGEASQGAVGIALGVNITPRGISISPLSTSSLMRRLGRARSVPPFRGGPEVVRRRMLMARMDQLGMAAAFDFYPSSSPMPIHDVTNELADIDPAYRMEFVEAIVGDPATAMNSK